MIVSLLLWKREDSTHQAPPSSRHPVRTTVCASWPSAGGSSTGGATLLSLAILGLEEPLLSCRGCFGVQPWQKMSRPTSRHALPQTPDVISHISQCQQLCNQAHAAIQGANWRYTSQHGLRLSTKNLHLHNESKKLTHCFIGPYKVTQRINPVTFRLLGGVLSHTHGSRNAREGLKMSTSHNIWAKSPSLHPSPCLWSSLQDREPLCVNESAVGMCESSLRSPTLSLLRDWVSPPCYTGESLVFLLFRDIHNRTWLSVFPYTLQLS